MPVPITVVPIASAAVPATAAVPITAAAVPATAGIPIAAGVRATSLRTAVHLCTGHTDAADQTDGGKQNYCKSFHDILLRDRGN
jgi:hypothetical protein